MKKHCVKILPLFSFLIDNTVCCGSGVLSLVHISYKVLRPWINQISSWMTVWLEGKGQELRIWLTSYVEVCFMIYIYIITQTM